jgi:hypothetical protein
MKIIHLKEVLDEMKKPRPFSVSFVTCDQERKTGGELIKLDRVILSSNEKYVGRLDFQRPSPNLTDFSKNPNHYEHTTRNVLLPNGMRRKLHIRLLLEFNGQKVFY